MTNAKGSRIPTALAHVEVTGTDKSVRAAITQGPVCVPVWTNCTVHGLYGAWALVTVFIAANILLLLCRDDLARMGIHDVRPEERYCIACWASVPAILLAGLGIRKDRHRVCALVALVIAVPLHVGGPSVLLRVLSDEYAACLLHQGLLIHRLQVAQSLVGTEMKALTPRQMIARLPAERAPRLWTTNSRCSDQFRSTGLLCLEHRWFTEYKSGSRYYVPTSRQPPP